MPIRQSQANKLVDARARHALANSTPGVSREELARLNAVYEAVERNSTPEEIEASWER